MRKRKGAAGRGSPERSPLGGFGLDVEQRDVCAAPVQLVPAIGLHPSELVLPPGRPRSNPQSERRTQAKAYLKRMMSMNRGIGGGPDVQSVRGPEKEPPRPCGQRRASRVKATGARPLRVSSAAVRRRSYPFREPPHEQDLITGDVHGLERADSVLVRPAPVRPRVSQRRGTPTHVRVSCAVRHAHRVTRRPRLRTPPRGWADRRKASNPSASSRRRRLASGPSNAGVPRSLVPRQPDPLSADRGGARHVA